MKKYATSPERGTFRKECDKKSLEKGHMDQKTYDSLQEYYDKYREESSKPLENNLEWDLRGCEWFVEKCKQSKVYSQNVYAALCNNTFINKENYKYDCSWRHAGGVVSHLNEKGDYIDWYCSGIGADTLDDEGNHVKPGYVGEGSLTEEIKQDFLKLGWKISNEE